MKTSLLFCALLLAGAAHSWAQGPSPSVGRPTGGADTRKKKSSEDTRAKALEAATSLYKAVPDDVKNKAKEMLTSPEAAAARQKALEAAQRAMQGNSNAAAAAASVLGGSTPAAAPMPAAGSQPPATTAEPTAAPSPGTPVAETPPPAAGPQPKPLQPLNLDEAPKVTNNMIRISAKKNAFFDVNKGYGIYTGDVRARHPSIYIECEELEIFMAKQDGGMLGGGAKPAVKAQDADIVAKKKTNDAPPIEKADARGPMVTVEKMSDQGDLQVGHCKHLIYDGKTGNTTLMEWPQVQVGNKLHKATEPGCVMIIDQKGMLTTHGGHETIILQGEDATPRSRAGTASAP